MNLLRHQAFWANKETDRPLLGINVGFTEQQHSPAVKKVIPSGLLNPDDIHTNLFLEDCERLYRIHRELDDDYPFVASPYIYVPWMEAIMGCPVKASPISIWAEPCITNWEAWHWQRPTLENPWVQKLLELMRALVNHSKGRYPVSGTMMRGPSDILAAMRGANQFALDFFDHPEKTKEALEFCAEVWIEIGKAQHALIPNSDKGYMDGDRGFRFWAPDRAIWLQEDAMAILSPNIYREFILPIDRRIAAEFPAVAFHLHSTGMWALNELLTAPEIDIIELNFEAASIDVEATFSGWKTIHGRKPLVIWRIYGDGFWPWLDRVLDEFSPKGLSIQITVSNLEQAKEVKAGFLERTGKRKRSN